VTLTFDLLTLKAVSESRVTLATSVPILFFLGLYVLDLGLMYATDRQTDRQTSDSIIAYCSRLLGAGHNNQLDSSTSADYCKVTVITVQQLATYLQQYSCCHRRPSGPEFHIRWSSCPSEKYRFIMPRPLGGDIKR